MIIRLRICRTKARWLKKRRAFVVLTDCKRVIKSMNPAVPNMSKTYEQRKYLPKSEPAPWTTKKTPSDFKAS